MKRRLVIFGLSLSSSWGNGHATTYRGLLRALAGRGWEIAFFERDVEWYRSNRDLPHPSFCDLRLYEVWDAAARAEAREVVRGADAVMVGSYAGQAIEVIDWLRTASESPLLFYDIDTPITLEALQRNGAADYLRADQVPQFGVYFSFTGGPALRELEGRWGARHAEALYCAVDPEVHLPAPEDQRFACRLGYMGTYSPDRQPKLIELLVEPARALPDERFIIALPQAPAAEVAGLPPNVEYIVHLYPHDHPAFYSNNWATLNITRDAMVRYGWAPSVRLFEAAACGACIVSDVWPGLDELLEPGKEILLARDRSDVLRYLRELTPERRAAVGGAARRRILGSHTYERRAEQLEAAYDRVVNASSLAEVAS